MSSSAIQLTVLGSGTSMGVPTVGCRCRVCTSKDPRDNRLRPSILLSRDGQHAVVDTTPDFRQQALRVGLHRLDAVLLTHGHADHIQGFDDIRPFNIRQKTVLPVYGNAETFDVLRRAFSYVFDGKPKVSSVPLVTLIEVNKAFSLLGTEFIPLRLKHGELDVLGFRFGRAAYMTDFSLVPDESMAQLEGLDDLILDALRDEPHPMHQTVDQALALVRLLKPKRAWFTHVAHDLSHAETNERLRGLGMPHVQLAYDGLQLLVSVDRAAEPTDHLYAIRGERMTTFSSPRGWHAHYASSGRGSVLAIGNFDGIHLGHQAILRQAVARAEQTGGVATALTFEPPPLKVLRPESAPKRLSTNRQRTEWFRFVGLESAVILPFTAEVAKISAHGFVEKILVDDLLVSTVLVGENFRFGHKQSGDVELLRELGRKHGFEVITIPSVVYRDEIVSSTVIRREVAEGNVSYAGRLLGRPFVLTGEIVPGTGTGHRFTVPTLNLAPEQELLPANGVYITRTVLEGDTKSYRSVTNIGKRPTFNGDSLSVETHLLDAPPEFQARRIEIRFWKRLREERRFESADALKSQIARDVLRTNRFFSKLRYIRTERVST